MADLSKWYIPETTKKEVYEGIYPVIISSATLTQKEAEKDDRKFMRDIVTITFKTMQEVPFPDKTTGQIIIEQKYYYDVQMHINALNGLGRAFGVAELKSTDQLEGKTGIIGITNRSYEYNGEQRKTPQFGYGLFSYAPLIQGATIKYIANEIPNPTEEDYKEWFKNTLAMYKQPR